jgi:hypothetical protein
VAPERIFREALHFLGAAHLTLRSPVAEAPKRHLNQRVILLISMYLSRHTQPGQTTAARERLCASTLVHKSSLSQQKFCNEIK